MAKYIDREALIEWLKRIPLKDLSDGLGLCRVIMEDDFEKVIKKMPKGIIKEEAKQVMTDAVQHPSHYTHGGIECIEAIRASMTADGFCDYCKGNIFKYIWRWRDKGGVEDLRKASVYLDWLINTADEKEKKGENSK